MMKRLTSVLLLVALAALSPAQTTLVRRLKVPLVESRSYGTNTYSACVTLGAGGLPLGDWLPGTARAKTVGSSTTVTSFTTAQNAFQIPNAGDSIRFLGRAGMVADPYRQIATNADNDTITVNRAIDLEDATAMPTGFPFEFRTLSCSTAAGASYVPITEWTSGNFLLVAESESSATGGIDYQVEAYVEGAANDAQIIATGNLTQAAIAAGGASASVSLAQFDFGTFGWTHVRILVKVSAGSVVYSVYAHLKN